MRAITGYSWMVSIRYRYWAILAIYVFGVNASLAQSIIVSGENLSCVQEYASSYISLSRNPILIILPECPNTKVTVEILNKYPQAYGGVDLGSCDDCSEDEVQIIISLTKEELLCLSEAPPIDQEKKYDISKIASICE